MRTIILAAHDDGSGAHVAMCHLTRGLLEVADEKEMKISILYLHGHSYGKTWAENLWLKSTKGKGLILNGPLNKRESNSCRHAWIVSKNGMELPKTLDGRIDLSKMSKMISEYNPATGFGPIIEAVGDPVFANVAMTIEMGVPQLTRLANGKKIPAIAISDVFWSESLSDWFQSTGHWTRELRQTVETLAAFEKNAKEIWLYPIFSSRKCYEYFARENVPVQSLPGFLGKRPTPDLIRVGKELLNQTSDKLVVLNGGLAPVWQNIYRSLGEAVKALGDDINFALLYPSDDQLVLIDQGKERYLRNPPSDEHPTLLPFYANADLGIVRGSVSASDFIACATPFLLVQELEHWPSHVQTKQANEAQLCHITSFDQLQDTGRAIRLIKECLGHHENFRMRARMNTFPFGVENQMADYLFSAHLS